MYYFDLSSQKCFRNSASDSRALVGQPDGLGSLMLHEAEKRP